MASRLFWIFLVVVALVGGMVFQQRSWLFDWGHDARIERATESAIEARVEQSIERRFDRMQVVNSDGETIDVAPQTKRELGHAVRQLVAAEAQLALASIRDAGDLAAVRSRRDAARAEVERLKNEIDRQDQLSQSDRDLVREHFRQSVRDTIRSAVRN